MTDFVRPTPAPLLHSARIQGRTLFDNDKRTGTQGLAELPIQLLEGLFQPGDVRGDFGAYGRTRLLQAILLRGQHPHYLLTPLEEGRERLALRIGQRAWLRTERLGEVGERRRIQRVGLGEPSGGLGSRRALGVD